MKTQWQTSEAKTSGPWVGVSRRAFIRRSLGASTLLAFQGTMPAFLSRSALAASVRADKSGSILVVLQLSGGNDGLNTVVPYENDVYHRKRPTLRLTAQKVLKIDGQLGFTRK